MRALSDGLLASHAGSDRQIERHEHDNGAAPERIDSVRRFSLTAAGWRFGAGAIDQTGRRLFVHSRVKSKPVCFVTVGQVAGGLCWRLRDRCNVLA